MKKMIRVVVFALVMAGAVTASFSSNVQASRTSGGDPIPVCDPNTTTTCQ